MKLATRIVRVSSLFLLFAVSTPAILSAQQAPAFKSTEVHADGSVTFRYDDPSAARVELILEDRPGKLSMRRGSSGIWSVTTPPLKPEIYGYRFSVDGQPKTHHDPQNPAVRYANNLITVSGNPPQPWEVGGVSHGNITRHTYTTKIVLGLPENQSEYVVYTPPGYKAKAAKPYPVLYLLHCWGDRPDSWNRFGQANIIFDNLIAQGRAKPMVVVMPLGYGDMKFAADYAVWDDPATVDHNLRLFSQALLTEVLPQVEHLYNVSKNRSDRAIIGASMGGLESLAIGLNHTSQFAWIGGVSSALDGLNYTSQLATFDPKTADLSLIWITCGAGDDLIGGNRKLTGWLRSKGLSVTTEERPGLHSYIVWRESLVRFASLIFQSR
ncbi:MAG: hypothetical protein JWQ42_366 [Edaphobacter sp.]|nr:hypothetical protein [Edaphobacter sp.]